MNLIKQYPFSLLTVALIWYLCFFTPPSTKLDHVIGIDKVVHFGMYAFLTAVMLIERNYGSTDLRNYGRKMELRKYGIGGAIKSICSRIKCQGAESLTMRYLFFTLISPILMSGLIEILQENCTGGRRSGDIWDFAANSLGAICAWLLWRFCVSRNI